MQGKNDLLENYRHLTQRSTGDGAIFTCAGFSIANIWNKTTRFLHIWNLDQCYLLTTF